MQPRDLSAEPTVEYIREIVARIDTYWAAQRTVDKGLVADYFNEAAVRVPDTTQGAINIEPERMTSGEAARIVDLIASFYYQAARIGMQWVGAGRPGSETTTERLELAINEAIDQLNPATDSPRRREIWQMVLLGRSARLILSGDAYWWDFPFKGAEEGEAEWQARFRAWHRQAPLPITWVDLPAESTFPASFGTMDDEVVSMLPITSWELGDMFDASTVGSIPEQHDDMQLVIYANRKWLAYALAFSAEQQHEDRILRKLEHGLGRCPIRITPGLVTGKKEPGKYWQSVLYPVRDLIHSADRRLSEAATASKYDALPILLAWLQEDDEGGGDIRKYLTGDVWKLNPEDTAAGIGREDVRALFIPEQGATTLNLAQFSLERAARISGAIEAIEGAFGPSGQPAWSRNFAAELAKSKFSPLTDSVIAADLDTADMILRAVSAFGEEVVMVDKATGGRMTLRPKDSKGYRTLLAGTYKLQLPLNRRADYELALTMMERTKAMGIPLPSVPWIAEHLLDIGQPMEMLREGLEWEFYTSDEVKLLWKAEIAQEAQMRLASDEAINLEELESIWPQLPPAARAAIAQRLGGSGGGGNGAGRVQTLPGAVRAGSPFSAQAGGPTPQEEGGIV